jgi:hypothetical protein
MKQGSVVKKIFWPALGLILIGTIYFTWGPLSAVLRGTSATPNPTMSPGARVTLGGRTACLPHKNMGDGSRPHTLECAMGLKADDGRYYGLKNAPMTLATEQRVRVEGVLEASTSDEGYDVKANIAVESVTQL